MTIQEYDKEYDRMMQELAALIPQFGTVRTVLLRMVAAKLQKESGVPLGIASAEINRAITGGIRMGYAMSEYDRRHPPKQSTITESGVAAYFLTNPVEAA